MIVIGDAARSAPAPEPQPQLPGDREAGRGLRVRGVALDDVGVAVAVDVGDGEARGPARRAQHAAARRPARGAGAVRRVTGRRELGRRALDQVDATVAVDVADPQPRAEAGGRRRRRPDDPAPGPGAVRRAPPKSTWTAPVPACSTSLAGCAGDQVGVAVAVEVARVQQVAVAPGAGREAQARRRDLLRPSAGHAARAPVEHRDAAPSRASRSRGRPSRRGRSRRSQARSRRRRRSAGDPAPRRVDSVMTRQAGRTFGAWWTRTTPLPCRAPRGDAFSIAITSCWRPSPSKS